MTRSSVAISFILLGFAVTSAHAADPPVVKPATRPSTQPSRFEDAPDGAALVTAMNIATQGVEKEQTRVVRAFETSPAYKSAQAELAKAESEQEKVRGIGTPQEKLDAAGKAGRARSKINDLRRQSLVQDRPLRDAVAALDVAKKKFVEAKAAWAKARAAEAATWAKYMEKDGPGLYRIRHHEPGAGSGSAVAVEASQVNLAGGDGTWTEVRAENREDAIRKAKNMRIRLEVEFDENGKPHYPGVAKVKPEDDHAAPPPGDDAFFTDMPLDDALALLQRLGLTTKSINKSNKLVGGERIETIRWVLNKNKQGITAITFESGVIKKIDH